MEGVKKDIVGCTAKTRIRTYIDQAQRLFGIKGIYTTKHALSYCELYSGSDKDPINWAHLDAERLAIDDNGNKLPYDITISLPALHFNREHHTLELLDDDVRKHIIGTQVLLIHVVVFETQLDKEKYNLADACFIREY